MKFTQITTFPALLEYLRDHLDWPFFEDDPEENRFDYSLEELGIDPKWNVAIERISQLRPSEGDGPWGIFYIEFEKKRLPVVVLRRILRALVPKARASANSSSRPAWNASDLLFICATGEQGHRGITFAHFREVEKHHIAQLRTFGWDETETHLVPLSSKLEKLRWENQPDWSGAFTLRHGQLVSDSKALATELAIFARGIRQRTLALYEVEKEDGQLHTLHKAFQSALIADMKPEGFADTVAQTIAYGLFAGRATGATLEKIGLAHLEGFVPKTNPFLRELFGKFTHLGLDVGKGVDFDDLGVVDLVEFLNDTPVQEITKNFGRQSGGGIEDPVVYFYENFLKEYDQKQRVQRGVYYTPKPVVDFIVRGVHQLLIDELGCPDGLADLSKHKVNGKDEFKVMILDPATGTGTFLQSAIEVIHEHLQKKWRAEGARTEAALKARWNAYVPTGLLPRLHGFELMMASYTVAHMKLGLKLQELGYDFKSDERLRVYLTNTLQPPHQSEQKALEFPDFLAHEAKAADEVKGETPITVVIGNPPYAIESANLSESDRRIVDPYRYVDGERIRERGAIMFERIINDDYVKFFAWNSKKLEGVQGVVGFVSNSGFLHNPMLRGMRNNMMNTFNQMFFLDLHGDQRSGPEDKNVFDISTGVAISLLVKGAPSTSISRGDLTGSRQHKYDVLSRRGRADLQAESLVPEAPFYRFFLFETSFGNEVQNAFSIDEIFHKKSEGIKTNRDSFVVGYSDASIQQKLDKFFDPSYSTEEIRELTETSDKSKWDIEEARTLCKATFNLNNFTDVAFRPFDIRRMYYHPSVVFSYRPVLADNVWNRDNLVLLTVRRVRTETHAHFMAVNRIAMKEMLSSADNCNVYPLYVYPSKAQTALDLDAHLLGFGVDKRHSNLAPSFVAQFGTKLGLKWQSDGRGNLTTHFGPEDVLAFMYAVFHAPSYRARYAELLKTDFPRVPLTTDADLFRNLVRHGHVLLGIHTFSSDPVANLSFDGPIPFGEVATGFPKYDNGRVQINKSSGFDDVPEAVWNFHIGGYQVAHKWLKDRKGRVLTKEDATHYRKIIWTIGETIKHMEAIDELIEETGGFPLAGSTEKLDVDVNAFFR